MTSTLDSQEFARVRLQTPSRLRAELHQVYLDAITTLVAEGAFRVRNGWADQVVRLVADLIEPPADAVLYPLRSGTDALMAALRACGVRAGSRVIVPDFAFQGVGWAVTEIGAIPVWADIAPDDWNLDPASVERLLRERRDVAAVIAVDNFGAPADWRSLHGICSRAGAQLIVDACENLAARRFGKSFPAFCDAAIASFNFAKPMHAAGMGGMLILNAKADRALPAGWEHSVKQRQLPELNAAFLAIGWDQMCADAHCLESIYTEYARLLHPLGFVAQRASGTPCRLHAPFLVPSNWPRRRRDRLIARLGARGIETRAFFDCQSSELGGLGPPTAAAVADRIICLPTGTGIARESVQAVALAVRREAAQSHQ